MSADPQITPGEPAPGTGHPQGSHGAGAGAPDEGSGGRGDRNDSWQAEKARLQSRADKGEAGLRDYEKAFGQKDGQLMTYARTVGPKVMEQIVSNYLALRGASGVGELIQKFEATGEIPSPSMSGGGAAGVASDDDLLTPEERELRALRTESAQLSVSLGQSALQGHLDKTREELFLNDEEAQVVEAGLTAQANQWSATPEGRAALRRLASPQAKETVKNIALQILQNRNPEFLFELGNRKAAHQSKQSQRFSTDSPSRRRDPSGEGTPKFKSMREAMEYAIANPDRT